MCRVLDVSPAGYYASLKRPPSWHALIDEVLMARVRAIHHESGNTYGSPRVHQELQGAGLPASPKRVARLMREEGLVARQRKRLLYLATVLDLGSRRCVGWAMRETMEVELALSALRMAREARRPEPGLIHHSDRGSQYAAGEYRAELLAHGMVASMSGKGDCYDNAVAESFFATLEFELLMQSDWHTREDARRGIFRYIETWYNRKRRHSTLGYISPAEYEADLEKAA